MKMKTIYIVCVIAIFNSGIVFSINLSRLIDVSDTYEASWVKVVYAVCIALAMSVVAWISAREE